ncbi:leucine--tRNA ligase [Winogradskyella flava]|uniref:Leucine--tRNA ligase n=1 Tax=Winogradskyella flava TaxID=1884876 RepID=A0A842IR33_9FLAO|nr:class I tRNA ligase family protein [Winogradskyella flava]MBC2844306.1 leucine--tRNA ligase [Winogradskyella flava]
MRYDFNQIEKKWQDYWAKNETFKASNTSDQPKYYVLDMFPYPSGAGLHVGHPLGYIASDIYARYKRHKGFNVLHPQGYDSFGLPAEQYAIQTGQHPAVTTEANIKTYRRQLDQIGFSFDWSREVRTSDPKYYKWTQWIFIQLFESWYNNETHKAEHIDTLVGMFKAEGNTKVNAACDDDIDVFTAEDWNKFSDVEKQKILLKYRLTYLAETEVNWCPALGTVLANDEIVNGVSERGGHPVVRKKMTQWSMRISAYAERLLQGLDTIDWTDALKDIQKNWIGKSVGASVSFNVIASEAKQSANSEKQVIDVFTTRPDTIFGVSFMTLAPEHELVSQITTEAQKADVEAYVEATSKRSERDRMADVKTISGVFTGAYAEHPFTKEPIPIWIGDYVLASYGTGAVMAVPCGDQRDYDFAKHFDIPIPNIFEGVDISEEAFASKDNVKIANSDFLNGLNYKKATKRAIYELEQIGQGEGKTNYRLRDAVFSRQRYWGEPFPVYYVNGMPQMINAKHLPLTLPEVEKYLPTEEGEPPLGRADVWAWDTKINTVCHSELVSESNGIYPLELNTMPGWAGSSWYFFRYMEDAMRDEAFATEDALKYWENVDLYIGGSEHATGHLLYSRFWVKFLYDRGYVGVDEPFKKLINQGMILGTSAITYRLNLIDISSNCPKSHDFTDEDLNQIEEFVQKYDLKIYISKDLSERGGISQNNRNEGVLSVEKEYLKLKKHLLIHFPELGKIVDGISVKTQEIYVDINIVELDYTVDIEKFLTHPINNSNTGLILFKEAGVFEVRMRQEKMSKSKYNVVNPDDIVEQYGADSLRLYEMFLGPLEQYKPWNTAGITGVHGFLKKLWKLYLGQDSLNVNDTEPTKDNLKTLHKTIKKVQEDIENFSFNTSVSTFMIAVNELTAQKCTSKEILEPLLVLISPYAPHIAEELWEKLGHATSISTAAFPKFEEKHLVESSKNYPISFNGKMRFTMELPLDLSKDDIEAAVMANEKTLEQLQGRTPKKVIVVPGKIVNIVG